MRRVFGTGLLWVAVTVCSAGSLWAGPIISEFVASNAGCLRDKDRDYPDWIEISNPSGAAVSLDGWYLTDDVNDLTKWEFPDVTLPGGGYLVVFASGKNDRDPEAELHTNFSLRAGGESVVLVEPDGVTVAHGYVDYPRQFADIAYGLSTGGFGTLTETTLVAEGAAAKALIPTSGALGSSWTQVGFDDSQWLSGTTGVGYDYAGLTGLDVGAMRNVNQSVYARVPFTVDDASAGDRLTLRLKYEDGIVAYLNGGEVVRANAPAGALAWDAGAAGNRSDSVAVEFEEFDITPFKDWLVTGENVLAFQGLNAGLSSSDLLIVPELSAVQVERFDLATVAEGYLLQPTPGAPNQGTLAQIGPAIRDVTENPPPPAANEDLIVTARVEGTLDPVIGVMLNWVVNFGDNSRTLQTDTANMRDDGTGGDAVAGDGIYTAVISSEVYEAGDMVRWSIMAVDTQARVSVDPLFPHPKDSPQYYGTIVQDPAVDTLLPVVTWFVENVAASESRGGTRGSVYYDGRFYDNIEIHIRGGSTAGAPKKHFKFKFNHGYKFHYRDGAPPVDEFNLNSTYSDKAYLRQAMAFEAYDWCGCPGSESFPVRAQRNGEFYGVQIFIEEPEAELLEREGLDVNGALYKMYNTFNAGGGAEKKTRRWEGRQDLDDFCRSINSTSGATQHNAIFDQVNLPLTLNYLAGTILTHQNDHPHKNHYLYRDSDGSGQWCFMPWDHDLTWGSNWTGSSYHDYIYAADDRVPGKPTDVKPSHPFVGKQDCQEWNYHWNRLTDALLNDTTVRQMYLRRLRTVMDELLQPPGTPYADLFIENHIDELAALMAADVVLDYRKWADPWSWGGQGGYPRNQSFAYALDVLKNDYLAVRRTHLFVTHNVDRVAQYNIAGSYSAQIPNAQPADAVITFARFEYNPPSGNQDEEYIELINLNGYAVDISGWRLTGGVEHTFLPGTVIVAGGNLHVSPKAGVFLRRASAPTGGQGLFVQGDYTGHLSSWGETVTLSDRAGRVVGTLTYAGQPSDQQQFLRVTEIMYHPAEEAPFDSEDYEFIELKNIGTAPLALAGVKLTDGVAYAFAGDSSLTLAGGACIVIAKDRAAFAARYGAVGINLAPGTYTGSLSNGGETIKLEDRTNSTLLEFTYKDGWFDETDGLGFSLVILDATDPDLDSWGSGGAWQPSAHVGGSPGTD